MCLILPYMQGGHWVDNLSNDSVQENAVKLQRPTSKDTASATASISAQQSVNSMLEDSNGRGERSPSQHKAMCHDSKVPDTNKGESSEDESTL